MINKIYSMIGLCMKAGRLAYGSDMCEEKIKNGTAKLVVVAEDASNNTKNKFENLCNSNSIDFVFFGIIEEISHYIGKNNKAIIAVLDEGFAVKLKEMLKEIKGANI